MIVPKGVKVGYCRGFILFAARVESFMVTGAPALVAVFRELRPADAAQRRKLRECLANGRVKY